MACERKGRYAYSCTECWPNKPANWCESCWSRFGPKPSPTEAQIADALLGAEEILEVLHMRGTKGLEQETNAGRVADVLHKVRACKSALLAPSRS